MRNIRHINLELPLRYINCSVVKTVINSTRKKECGKQWLFNYLFHYPKSADLDVSGGSMLDTRKLIETEGYSLIFNAAINVFNRKWWPILMWELFIFGLTFLPENSIGGTFERARRFICRALSIV